MNVKSIYVFLLLLYNISRIVCVSPEFLQLSNLRYNECGRFTCPETGKFQFSPDNMYEYLYTLSINSTFDKKAIKNSQVTLEFKAEIRIESCEGVMRVSRATEKQGFAVFEEDGYDKIYEDMNRYLVRFSFYDGFILNVCPHEEESISSLNIKKGILTAFQNRMKRFDIDKSATERDINGYCPTNYNLQRINGTTLVIRKIKDIGNCLERCQLHSIVPTSKFIFQSRFHKWTPLNSTVVCHQTIDHRIPVLIHCHEEHMLKIMPNQTYSSRTLIDQRFQLVAEIPSYANLFTFLRYPEVTTREDLSFNHRKPKKSEVTELEDSEVLLLQLCNIMSEEFQPDAADVFARFIHTARHLSLSALETLLEKGSQICASGRKHVQDSLPFLRSTAALSLMKDIINSGGVPESTANGWLFAMSLFTRPDQDVIESVTPMLYEDTASNNVMLSISSIIHAYNVYASEYEDKEVVLNAITYLETTINETLISREDLDKISVLLKSLGNAGVETETMAYTLAACISNPAVSSEVKIAAIEAHRRLRCDFNVEFLLSVYTNTQYEAEIRIAAYLQIMKCPSYRTVKWVKQMLQSESLNQVGSFVWSHIQNIMKSSLEYRVHLQALLQDYTLQEKFKTDFRKYSRNYEYSFHLTDYGIGSIIIGNVIFSTKTYIPKYLTFNLTVNVFGELINVIEVNIFVEGFEKYVEKVFKGGTDYLTNKLEKWIAPYRSLRSIPMTISEKIKYLWNNLFGSFAEPSLVVGVRLFGNEIMYTSCRGKDGLTELLNRLDVNNIVKDFLTGQEIKYDYSTVFMDISYVSPTGAGVPLNMDVVGISITNFDTSVFMNFTDFSASDTVLIDGKLKPRFSLNFEGSMGTDLVYEQTQVQLRNKIYTSSEMETKFSMKTSDNISFSFGLPPDKFDIFSFQSDLYYKSNTEHKDIMIKDTSVIQDQPSCFWPFLEQTLGLKVCSTYYTSDPEIILQSILNVLKGPFKFRLYVEKSDPTAKVYLFRYNKRIVKINESSIVIEFETPGSLVPRSMKTLIYTSSEINNLTITVHANRTTLEAHGFYKYTPADKVLHINVDINGLRHIDFDAELHMRHDKRIFHYVPKLYLAISSKPVLELSGTYNWVEKKGISQCDVDLQFKTNKFDSNITGYIMLSEGSVASNMHIHYKFEKVKNESLNFEFKIKDQSTKMKTLLLGNVQVESTSYPENNFGLNVKYQKSHEHIDARFDYVSSPFELDDAKKLIIQGAFSYLKSFNGLKLNTFIEIRKEITDVNIKVSFSHHNNPTTSNTIALIRYAKDRDIIVKLEIYSPQTQVSVFHYEVKLNVTLPTVQQPMIAHIRISKKFEDEYNVDFIGTWFSGHTAMAKGVIQDKSTHYANNYIIKMQLRSRLFNEISLSIKLNFNALEHKAIMSADHNDIKYALFLRHFSSNDELHEAYAEYVYNNSVTYYLNNQLDLKSKEFLLELHLDRYRNIHLAAKGRLKRWDSDVGFELQWDFNRDPSQKIVVNFNTKSMKQVSGNQYMAKFTFEYPGHISEISFYYQQRENYKSLSLALEMNPTSIIELMAYSENELFTYGYTLLGFKLLTPFENWKETAFFHKLSCQKQSFQSNGNLTWQGDQNIIFDAHGGYSFEENITSVSLSSYLNSTLQDLSALAFQINYTSVEDHIYLNFILQPNVKYALSVSTFAMIKHYLKETEYMFNIRVKAPFLEFSDNELSGQLKVMTENRIVGGLHLRLNHNVYNISTIGALNLFERSRLCLHIITPIAKFEDIAGLLHYDFEQKHIFLNLTGAEVHGKVNLIYVYNNVSNFHLRLEVSTPLHYLNQIVFVAMFNNKQLETRVGWNTLKLGFAGMQHFASWSDLEYRVHLYTPIELFKETEGVFKILLNQNMKIVAARIVMTNITKIGINFAYNSDKGKTIYRNECGNIFAGDMLGIDKTTILTNGLFELDTLIYPTITGIYIANQSGNRYTTDAKVTIFFLKMNIWNQIDYESMESFNNTFLLKSSIDIFSSIQSHVMVSKPMESKTHLITDLEVVRFGQNLKAAVDLIYEYKTIDASLKQIKNKIDGIHNFAVKLITPFEQLEEGEITIMTQIENYAFQTVVEMATNYTNVSLIADLQFLENYFDLNTAFEMSSLYITVPSFKLKILRDFVNLEKRIAFVLKEPTSDNKGFHDFFCVKSTWYVGNRDHISLSGEIISPVKILDELKVSLLYTHNNATDNYYLEAYMKYSNKTEMKARANLKAPNVTLNLETSMEGLRNAHFTGTLEKIGPGQQKINAVMITNSNFQIQGSSSVTNLVPFAIKGKLLRGKDKVEISSVEMAVKQTPQGYSIIAFLFSKGKSLSVETAIADFPDDVRIINLNIKTGRGDMEYLNVNAELKLQYPGIYILTVKGDTSVNDNNGKSVTTVEIWLRNGIGALFVSLDSTAVKSRGELFCVWKPPTFIYAGSKIHFSTEKKMTEVFNSKIYFLKEGKSYNNLSTGLIINLNKKWMMETNATVMVNSSNDAQMAMHLVLPNTNAYSLIGSVKYDHNYDVIKHVISISRPQDIPCYTISDVNLVGQGVCGLFAFRCGIKDTLFMVNNFRGKKNSKELVIRNWLKSNTLTNALVTNVTYRKNYNYHVLNLEFFYPPTKRIAVADVNFESTDNFDSFINTTTPYKKMPYFVCTVISKTSEAVYQRCGKVYLQDQPAFVNISHVKTPTTHGILNDGNVALKFPISTWHEGTLLYTYLNTSVYINGTIQLFYNEGRITNGTFTRNSTRAQKFERGFTHLEIGNKLMPVGVNYIHETDVQKSDYFSHDFKRMEVFKLQNASVFNITGETLLESIGTKEWTTIKLFNFNRSVVLKSHTDGRNIFQNGMFITLKREFWFNYDLKTNKTSINTLFQKIYDLNLAYPRRNFSIVSLLTYGENYFASQFVLNNFLTDPTKSMGIDLLTIEPTINSREFNATIFHPSFEKNVTIFVSFLSMKTILADLNANVEYSMDQQRKLELRGIIEDKSMRGNRHYILRINGAHPATRFKLDVQGAFKSETGNHYVGNNISYSRSYLPEQFWNGRAMLNTKRNIIDIKRVSTRALIHLHGDYEAVSSKHIVNTKIIEGVDTHVSGNFQVDLKEKQTYSIVNLTEDASERLEIEGGIPENRDAKFNIWKIYNNFNFPQISFHFTLNHSRFLSSALLWRTDVGTNILRMVKSTVTYLWSSAQESAEFWTQFLRSEATETVTAVWNDAKPELEEFLEDFHDIKSIQDNINHFKKIFNDSYNANEFFLKDIHELYNTMTHDITFLKTLESFPKLFSEIVQSMGETSLVIRRSLIWLVSMIKELYDQLLNILDQLAEGKASAYISKFVKKGTEKFDAFVKDLHISFISTMETAVNEIMTVLSQYQKKLMVIFEPTFIEIVHHIDSTFWASSRKLIDFLYARKNELLNSPFLLRSANFTQKMDAIYKDLMKNDFTTNVKKYFGVFVNVFYEYYLSQIPYREEIASIGTEIVDDVKELYKLPLIAYTVDNIKLMYNQVMWLYEYFDITTKIQRLIPFFYRQLRRNSYTALELQLKSQKPKTKFSFIPESGIVKMEQKLPFPWHAFNETPIYEELEEYKFLKKVQSFLSTSNLKLWSFYKNALTLFDPQSWFPPFKRHAQLIGFNNYITFDSRHIPFYGNSCQYLLSHDFMDSEFSLVLNGDERNLRNQQSISLLLGQETITIQFEPVRLTVDSQKISKFPLQLNTTYIYFDREVITVEINSGITLKCNMFYHICSIHLSGWFFGKVSGLLGTMNNEPSDDVYKTKIKNENYLWSLNSERSSCPVASNVSMIVPDYGVNQNCSLLFLNVSSPFEPCFNEVNPAPYYDICATDILDENVCSVSMAYVQSCSLNSIPLRIPTFCIKCGFATNRYANEGTFVQVEGRTVPQSSDIIFIVEAKPCNQDLLIKKNIQLLVNAISKELIVIGITQNRYSLVTFGGKGVHDKPHSVVVNSTPFSTNATQFTKYFEDLPTGNGSSDVFGALRFASKVSFRVGVSKTFILLLCSNCDPAYMDLDYSVLHHAMIEKSITLHILMNENFLLDKLKTGKVLFGIDSYTAYTKNEMKGDYDSYKQIKLTKSLLGYCTPLALESNGTLFTAKLLSDNRLSKKFASVFAKRVALTAKPNKCQMCECHSDDNGIPNVECISCSYPTPINFDFSMDDDNDFSPTLMNFD